MIMSISIYKLTVDGYKACYIGSTKRDPHERFLEHARAGNRCASRVLFRLGQPVKMEIVAKCTQAERDNIEKYHILNTPHTINRTIPGDYSFLDFKRTATTLIQEPPAAPVEPPSLQSEPPPLSLPSSSPESSPPSSPQSGGLCSLS